MSDERIRKLVAEIQRYIDSEKAAASSATDIGTTRQGTEDACRAARVSALASMLYLIEKEAVLDREAHEILLHAKGQHPDYEYATTRGGRKLWYGSDVPPEGEGWERNIHMGRDGWERFDYHEESYWLRRRGGE